jgi:oligopeptide transport system substrate-binding protein
LAGLAILLTGCEPSSPSRGSGQLASDQTFTYAVAHDIGVDGIALDPEAVLVDSVSATIAQNVFGGLYRHGEHQELVPEIAVGLPEVSADGRQYTFHLRRQARFSNGDPVRASDFVYSWNRAAADEPDNFVGPVPIAGFDAVARHDSPAMSGLVAPDDQTLIVRLTQPAGYWLSELLMPSYWVVDQKVILSNGVDRWWTTPEGLIGTGPFKMTLRTPGRVMEFEPVPDWWGLSTGHLKKVRVVVVADPAEALRQYDAGTVQSISLNPGGPIFDLSYYLNGRRSDLVLGDPFATTWVAFNLNSGPFRGLEAGRDGRRAFSLSIDRAQLAKSLCGQTCEPATGGLVLPGVQGYLGDNEDPNARFDAARARDLYRHWDPDGSKVASLSYAFNFTPVNWRLARALQQQWKTNLGVDVKLDEVGDFGLFRNRRSDGDYYLFRAFWLPDYDSPADWIDPLSPNRIVQMGGYANPAVDALAEAARAKSPDIALPMYLQAERSMVDDAAYAAINYPRTAYLVKPFVQGEGSSAFIGHPWSEIKILSH